MMISFNKYPIDIFLCILWSIILIPFIIFDVELSVRIILGLPFILFIPGYVLIFFLYPLRKSDKGISKLVRLVLSLGFSIAIVSLIGLGLNYTSFGINQESVFTSIFIFIIGIGLLAIYRWYKTDKVDRFVISLNLSKINSKNKIEKILNLVIIISIIIAIVIGTYVLIMPKQGEKFTSFYILNSEGNNENYPQELEVNEAGDVIFGILNHQYETINYTVEVWLIEEFEDNSDVQNMWFLEKVAVILKHTELEIEEGLTTQWEYPYSFSFNKTGTYKLVFLLYKSPTYEYKKDTDYSDFADDIINSAYRETHIWITIN